MESGRAFYMLRKGLSLFQLAAICIARTDRRTLASMALSHSAWGPTISDRSNHDRTLGLRYFTEPLEEAIQKRSLKNLRF
jgi:hypothetical protein